jgi:cell division septum initiation protein DivIVA
MTKAEEITAFRNFTATYPPDTYLGKWLREIADLVEVDIRNDHFPTQTPRESFAQGQAHMKQARIDADGILERARRDAQGVITNAEAVADKIREEARQDAKRIAESFQCEIRALQYKLGNIAA